MYEWGNINSFTVLIWLFIPFLLAAKVFTTPEFLEKRFNNALRQFFAVLTVICNVLAFLAAFGLGAAGPIAMNVVFDILGSYHPAFMVIIGLFIMTAFIMGVVRPPRVPRYATAAEMTP